MKIIEEEDTNYIPQNRMLTRELFRKSSQDKIKFMYQLMMCSCLDQCKNFEEICHINVTMNK